MHKDIILFGVQGSGKGTQAQILAERLGYVIFEAGAELRKIRASDTDLGRQVKSIIDAGNLVPNEIVMAIVAEFLKGVTTTDKVIFDGLPRSMVQKESLDALLAEAGRETVCLLIELPRETAIARMQERGRADDTDEVIKTRIENFEAQTVPVIALYEQEGKLVRVHGDQPIEQVTEDILDVLAKVE